MKIENIKINWKLGWANDPKIRVLCSDAPSWDEFRYKYADRYYWAEREGLVSFFAYSGPGSGFGGRTFTLTMENGEQVDLVGPWSGSSVDANRRFPHCVEISFTDKPSVMRKGYTFSASCMLVDVLRDALRELRPELALLPFQFNTDDILSEDEAHSGECSVRYRVMCSNGALRPTVSEINRWDDVAGMASEFANLYDKFGIEDIYAAQVYYDAYSAFWKVRLESLPMYERPKHVDEFEARYLELEYPRGTEPGYEFARRTRKVEEVEW